MFRIKSPAVGDELYPATDDEGRALLLAVTHVIENGADAEVTRDDNYGHARWYCEADTKVEDTAPTYPVIVHFLDAV